MSCHIHARWQAAEDFLSAHRKLQFRVDPKGGNTMDGIVALVIVIVFGIVIVKGMGLLASRSSAHPVKRRHNKWHR
jgi:hypothetical protein